MKVLRTVHEVREFRSSVSRVGFVPTMGALHAGHLHLMKLAASENDVAMGSIFVNPLQFGANEDLSKYPRQELEDIEKADAVGVQAMFCPSVEEMVGENATTVSVRGVADMFEGEKRPGHFDGVATIVAQLFGIVQPDRAYFGLKDLQQCAVVRQMVRDLCMPVELRFIETIREESGLALSSRNEYFTPEERYRAAYLSKTLRESSHEIISCPSEINRVISEATQKLASANFDVEYLEMVDPDKMVPVRDFENDRRLIVAARFYGVRLIDNLSINS